MGLRKNIFSTYQYGFEYVLSNVVQVEIVCDNSDNQMVAHQCESFDVDEDFQAVWIDGHKFHIDVVEFHFLQVKVNFYSKWKIFGWLLVQFVSMGFQGLGYGEIWGWKNKKKSSLNRCEPSELWVSLWASSSSLFLKSLPHPLHWCWWSVMCVA